MAYHRLGSLILESDQPIPGLPQLSEINAVDIKISLDADNQWLDPEPLEGRDWKLWYDSQRQCYRSLYSWGSWYEFDPQGLSIRAGRFSTCSEKELWAGLLGPALGFCLHLRGLCPLHASAVEIRSRGVVFLGRSGSGKSTVATALWKRGHRHLTDDIALLSCNGQSVEIQQGLSQARLWPDSVEHLFGHSTAWPELALGWDKRVGTLESPLTSHSADSIPIHRLFVLGERREDYQHLRRLSPAQTLLALQGHAYMNLEQLESRSATEFSHFTQIATRIQAEELHPPSDFKAYSAYCDWIEQQVDC